MTKFSDSYRVSPFSINNFEKMYLNNVFKHGVFCAQNAHPAEKNTHKNKEYFMPTQISFTKYENDIIHDFRNKIHGAESSEDVKKFFDYAIRDLCNKVFSGNIKLKQQDFEFTQGIPLFQIHNRLFQSETFKNAWENSDLPNIIDRFAQTANNRFIHLKKHKEKTNLKIRR